MRLRRFLRAVRSDTFSFRALLSSCFGVVSLVKFPLFAVKDADSSITVVGSVVINASMYFFTSTGTTSVSSSFSAQVPCTP